MYEGPAMRKKKGNDPGISGKEVEYRKIYGSKFDNISR